MRPPNPMDEARVLARLREGRSAISLARELHVHVRRVAALARENGVRPLRRVRTDAQLAMQNNQIRDLRRQGLSWTQIAKRLGYEDPSSGRIAVRNRAVRLGLCKGETGPYAQTTRALYRRLRKANGGRAGWDDIPSFLRMAASERMHWLLTPAEIELARRFRLLPEHCMGERASVLIERSLHMPPATPRPVRTDYMDN